MTNDPLACAGSPHRVHRSTGAKSRCWACSSSEKLTWTPEDEGGVK